MRFAVSFMLGYPPAMRVSESIAEARTLASLAWPVTLTSLNWTIMHLIDVAVVGHAGTHELGALAAARAILYVILVTGLSGLSGILVFVSRADGAGKPGEAGDMLRAGVMLALLIGGGASLLLLFLAEPLILGAGVAPLLAPAGARVGQVMALGFPPQFAVAAASYFLEGISQPRRVTMVNFSILPMNALLAWILADGRFGMPAMGAVGAAAATAIASWAGLVLIAIAVWTLPDATSRGVHDLSGAAWGRARALLPEIARFGAVPALAAGLELLGFSILIALSTRIGTITAAAFQAVFSLHNLGFAFGIGMGSATGVRVGHAVGAGEPEHALPRTLIAAAMALALMAVLSILYLLFAPQIVGIFSGDPQVVSLGAALLAGLALFMPFDGLQAVFLYALRSLGDQIAAGINGVIGFFVITGGLGWLLVSKGCGPLALVWAAGIGMIATATLQGTRLLLVSRKLSARRTPQSSG